MSSARARVKAPVPEPKSDCVELYGWSGFNSAPLQKACDSTPGIDSYFFYGVKFPSTTISGKPIKLMTFPWQNCGGDWELPVEHTTEFTAFGNVVGNVITPVL